MRPLGKSAHNTENNMIFSGHSRISGVGSFLPEQSVTSIDLLEELKSDSRFGIPVTWLDDNMGIRSRRYFENKDKTSEVATIAALRAIEDAGIDPLEIDGINYCGITGDFIEPGTAHVIQHNLGAVNSVCKDIRNASHGFSDGIFFSDMMIGSAARHILIVTTEKTEMGRMAFSRLSDAPDADAFMKKIGLLSVGDAAAAFVMSRRDHDETGIQAVTHTSSGNQSHLRAHRVEVGFLVGQMLVKELEEATLENILSQRNDILDKLGWTSDDVKHVVTNLIGDRLFNQFREHAGFAHANMPHFYPYLGDTTTATVPLAYEQVKNSPSAKAGDKVCIASVGSGIVSSWICLNL